MSMSKLFRLSLLSVVFIFFIDQSFAHKVTAVSVVSKFDTQGRKYSVELAMDIYPSEDQATNDEISPEQAADFFSKEALDLFFGDTQIKPQAKSELLKDPNADPEIQEVKVKVLVTLFGDIPKDAGNFTLRVSPDTTAAVVMVTFKDGKAGRRAEVLYPGEFSSPVDVSAIVEGDPFADVGDSNAAGSASGESNPKEKETVLETDQESQAGSAPQTDSESDQEEAASAAGTMKYFVGLGMDSFFSVRYESVLLALCFFFFSQKPRDLFFQVAMFVVTYSLALGMAVLGVVSIAGMSGLSGLMLGWMVPVGISVLAVENLFAKKLHWWRMGIIAVMGILMGTVYSMTLSIAGMAAESVTTAFAGFDLGYQLGLLLSLVFAALVVFAFWSRDWYQRYVSMPVCLLIAGVGMFWIIQQAFFSG